jgi:hypothetical protein
VTPADQGLSTLGMLMQLAGSTFAAFMTMLMLVMLGDGVGGWMLAVFGLSITRSFVQRNAGKDLLYGATNRLAGIRLYVVVGLVQSVLVAAIAWWGLDMAGREVFGLLAGLAAWPACLAIVFARPRFRRFRDVMPLAEDKGFEGASILMVVLGLSGIGYILTAAIVVLAVIEYIGEMAYVFWAVLAVLLVRSILHVQAGFSGLRETTFDKTIVRAKRYADFSVTTAFALAGALLLFNIAVNGGVIGLALIGAACWLLLAWPMIVRQFFADRQISELIAGDDAPPHHRAPDAGLTNLGWLLLAHAMLQATILLPDLFGTPLLLHVGDRSIWISVAVVALQAWAGAELIRMSSQSRFIATAFGTLGTLAVSYVAAPAMQHIEHITLPTAQTVATYGFLFLDTVIPPTTLFLVNRKVTPTARARFRT